MNRDMRTHENEDAIGVFLQTLCRLIVFFLCDLRIHAKERPRAVIVYGFALRWLR